MSANSKVVVLGDSTVGDAVRVDGCARPFDAVHAASTEGMMAELARGGDVVGIISTTGPLRESFRWATRRRTNESWRPCPTAWSCSTPTTRSSGATAASRSGPSKRTAFTQNFYTVLKSPEILGPDMCPFNTARASGKPSSSTLHSGEKSITGSMPRRWWTA